MCTLKDIKTVPGVLKILELIFVIITFGIYKGAELSFDLKHYKSVDTLATGILISAFIITTSLLICYLVGQSENIKQTFLESIQNLILFLGLVVIGGLGIDTWKSGASSKLTAEGLAMSSISLLAAMCYLLDFVAAVIIYNRNK
ncbi:hypothetical protein SK128_008188 [Halocaridina rubra]|uniref:MARVEL domain-containing protein n=1 Tax=Halocaridina rubra TaxID=373956 RepID=A0AAN8ZXQ9_HALRR